LLWGGCWDGLIGRGLAYAIGSAMTAAAESDSEHGAIEVALVETFEQPVGFVLSYGAVSDGLLDLGAHLFAMDSLDGFLHVGDVHALFGGDLFEGLSALQGGGEFVSGHAEDFGGGFEFSRPEAAFAPGTAAPVEGPGGRRGIIRVGNARADSTS
jgi:hypothetical protein